MTGIYAPVDAASREIRLLRLRPWIWERGGPEKSLLEFELATFRLDDQPDFVALSYCWGRDPPTETIRVNGCEFLVRPNLHDWLQRMLRESHDYWVFIDAICINQQDDVEKSSQVGMMGDIYRDAAAVVAWLGEEERSIEIPGWHRAINRYAARLTLEMQQMGAECLQRPTIINTQLHPSKDAVLAGNECSLMGQLGNISGCPYWTRTWIVPELLLARSLTIRRGDLDIDWIALLAMIEYYCPSYPKAERDTRHLIDPKQFEHSFLTFVLLQEREWAGLEARLGKVALSDATAVTFTQKCSEPHDRVYSLLGITAAPILPHYQRDLQELYVRTLYEGLRETELNWKGEDFQRRAVLHTFAFARSAGLNLLRSNDYFVTRTVMRTFPELAHGAPTILMHWVYSTVLPVIPFHQPRMWVAVPVSYLLHYAARPRVRAAHMLSRATLLVTRHHERNKCAEKRTSSEALAALSNDIHIAIDDQKRARARAEAESPSVMGERDVQEELSGLRSDSHAHALAEAHIRSLLRRLDDMETQSALAGPTASEPAGTAVRKHKLCLKVEYLLVELWNRGLSSPSEVQRLRVLHVRHKNIDFEGAAICSIDSITASSGPECQLKRLVESDVDLSPGTDASIAVGYLMSTLSTARDGKGRIPACLRTEKYLGPESPV